MSALNRLIHTILNLGAGGGQLAIAGGIGHRQTRALDLKIPRPRTFERFRDEELDRRLEAKFAEIREEEKNILDKLIVLD